jgi:hypothetical protein
VCEVRETQHGQQIWNKVAGIIFAVKQSLATPRTLAPDRQASMVFIYAAQPATHCLNASFVAGGEGGLVPNCRHICALHDQRVGGGQSTQAGLVSTQVTEVLRASSVCTCTRP